jgi:hypothetical protein
MCVSLPPASRTGILGGLELLERIQGRPLAIEYGNLIALVEPDSREESKPELFQNPLPRPRTPVLG